MKLYGRINTFVATIRAFMIFVVFMSIVFIIEKYHTLVNNWFLIKKAKIANFSKKVKIRKKAKVGKYDNFKSEEIKRQQTKHFLESKSPKK